MGSYLNPLTNAPPAWWDEQQQGTPPALGPGQTDPTGDARRAAAGPIDYKIDTTGLQVQPDINGSYSGMVNFGGVPTKINVNSDGQIFDETGRNITSRFNPADTQKIVGAFQQTSGDPTFQPMQVHTQTEPPPDSGTGTPPPPGAPPPPSAPPPPPSGGGINGGGYVPFDPYNTPDAKYNAGPGQTGGNNPRQNYKYDTSSDVHDSGPGGILGYDAKPFLDPSGNRIDEKIANDRIMAYSQGNKLSSDINNWTGYNQGQVGDTADRLQSAYDMSNPANAGYTDPEKGAILNNDALQKLQLTPDQEQSNYLTQGEQQGIYGDPYAAWNQLSGDEQAMNANTNQTEGIIRGDIEGQGTNIRGAYTGSAQQSRGIQSQMQDATRPYVDPTALNASADYMQNYNVTPHDQQNIRDKAGRQVRTQEMADEDRLMQAAHAQGNTSPLALSTMRDRLRQTGAVNEANAMSDAEIAAKQLQLNTTQGRENTRLGAAQNYAGLGTGTELALGQAAQGAEQYIGNQQQQAEQYLGSSQLNNEQQLGQARQANTLAQTQMNNSTLTAADAANSARSAELATNRQGVNQSNQGQEFARGSKIYDTSAAANKEFADTRLAQRDKYTAYLGNQNTQANQNVGIGQQQQANVFATTTGAANKASENAVVNYKTPGAGIAWFGKKGGVLDKGPQLALIGEAGPELVIDLDKKPEDYGIDKIPHYGLGFNPDDVGSGETEGPEGHELPGGTVQQGDDPAGANPLWSNIHKGLFAAQQVAPSSSNSENWHGGGLKKILAAASMAIPKAAGGIVGTAQGGKAAHHPYGKKGLPKSKTLGGESIAGGMELVTKPTLRILGAKVPQAVVPLTKRPGNKVTMGMIPGLMKKYGSYGASA